MEQKINPPILVIRQNLISAESSVISVACMLMDIQTRRCDLSDLGTPDVLSALKEGAMPVGSVEFVREAMRVCGIKEPVNLSYPLDAADLGALLCREVRLAPMGEVKSLTQAQFIKPARTKQFTGFVYEPGFAADDYDKHDKEQFEALQLAMQDPSNTVWISSVVSFAGEWRYYVLDGAIVGSARYDPDGEDDVKEPDAHWLDSAAAKLFSQTGVRSFSMDVGRLADGREALVECNDGWALGLYGKALSPRDYLAFLWARWSQLHAGAFAL